MPQEVLKNIIGEFNTDEFIRFFRDKNRAFAPQREELSQYDDNDFKNGLKLGEIDFKNERQNLIICTFEVQKALSERVGKKSQYEKAKKILKDLQADSGIFIFYDANGNFRFSLIYANYLGRRRDWSIFRRFTYFVSREQTNKTFLQRIGNGDFSTLEKIKEAFSVEKVTKDFYKDIANWYFWAVQNSQFPKDAETEENGRNIAVIRLITRLIFIWFMRKRSLVPNDLFYQGKIKNYLKTLSPEDSTYYKAILQNLFFATLSTKQKQRKYASEKRFNKGWNEDYGNQYVFRYHELFKNPDDIKTLFKEIPFLNGGLFECLDEKEKKNKKGEVIKKQVIIDGFSRVKKNQPSIPNFLFFSDEQEADLNREYGTKKEKYKVRGIIDILSSYNFTIDENDPNDAEVALDPELLGKVFENLLASFNPETSSTARKATGSYYTPREIVDYMVTQSLKEYFKTNLSKIEKIDDKLDKLFANGQSGNPFDGAQSKKLVALIDNLRIVDPAVGSGAFPMGILNKLVHILGKLDPENKLWKEAQIEAVKDNVKDPVLERKLIAQIEEQFTNKNFDYGRKLYLIQKCIYGVDIQQTAVEIAKLRFFIALLVDEKIDKTQKNWGIEPLPNLDFKIMQGNSLISEFMGIDFDNGESKKDNGQLFSNNQEVQSLIDEFQQKKNEFQNESDKDKKQKFKQEIDDLMIKIFENKLKKQKQDYFAKLKTIEDKYSTLPNKQQREEIIAKEKQALSKKEGFDLGKFESQLREFSGKTKVKPFFAWKLYFAEVFQGDNPGFDIVIGNPPYVRVDKIDNRVKDLYIKLYTTTKGKYDLYYLFFELGLNMLKNKAVLTYITPNKFCAADSAFELRKLLFFTNKTEIVSTSMLGIFNEASNYPIITKLVKNVFNSETIIREAKAVYDLTNSTNNYYKINRSDLETLPSQIIPINCNENEILFVLDLIKKNVNMGQFIQFSEGLRIKNAFEEKHKKHFHIVKQYQFEKWSKIKAGTYISKNNLTKVIAYKSDRYQKIMRKKILIAEDSLSITGTIDNDNCIPQGGVYFGYAKNNSIILALLNSKLLSKIYKIMFGGMHMGGGYLRYRKKFLETLPIPKNVFSDNKLEKIANKILAITKSPDYLQNSDKQDKVKKLEAEIDQMVYKLYDLTPEEIAVVEGENK